MNNLSINELQPARGESMDEKIVDNRWPWKKIGVLASCTLSLAGFSWMSFSLTGDRSFRLDANTLNIGEVTQGVFEDFIPIRGRVMPLTTVYLDAVEGGRVEKVYVEDGQLLKQGDLIISLSNTTLQLSVTNSEAQVAEQLNAMRTIELALEQNRLRQARELVDVEYRIITLNRQLEGDRQLVANGSLNKRQLDMAEDELVYRTKQRELILESQRTDVRMQEQQLSAQRLTAERLEGNLEITRQNLEGLNIRAPRDGKLSGFDAEVGQSIVRGGRLGQIEGPDHYKLRVNIDEFYLNRVDTGQTATFEQSGRVYPLEIKKIYPQVISGQFQVDLNFINDEPSGIRRGQTLQARLTLGDETLATLIPNGAFFQDTGGNWIFILNDEGSEAVRRNISLGRRNNNFIEVVEGLQPGEKVIVSSYSSYLEIDRLKLQGQ